MTDSRAGSASLVALPAGTVSFERFDPKVVAAFSERSVSEETRRAYRRVVREFFQFTGNRHPAEITTPDVQRWRDQLIADKKSAATVTFKLSVIRSFFDYLKIAGLVSSNPALTRLVRPPRSLTTCEAAHSRRKKSGMCSPGRIAPAPKGRATMLCYC